MGRWLLVQRVRFEGWPVAHAAKAMGISRKSAHHWLGRYDLEGRAGLEDRSSRPRTSPNQTPPEIEQRVLDARRRLRAGPDRLGPEVAVPAEFYSDLADEAAGPQCSPSGSPGTVHFPTGMTDWRGSHSRCSTSSTDKRSRFPADDDVTDHLQRLNSA